MKRHASESGFALLITLIVVGVVLSVGLTILDLSIKQVRLSTNAKDSEIAFHAANAGMECAQYWRRKSADEMERGQAINPVCFGVNAYPNTKKQLPIGSYSDPNPVVIGDGEVFQYEYSFTWGPLADRCTRVNTVVASSTLLGVGVTTTKMTTLMPGYPDIDGTNMRYCEAGARCSVISVKGYNKPCPAGAANFGYGVVEREVLLQF